MHGIYVSCTYVIRAVEGSVVEASSADPSDQARAKALCRVGTQRKIILLRMPLTYPKCLTPSQHRFLSIVAIFAVFADYFSINLFINSAPFFLIRQNLSNDDASAYFGYIVAAQNSGLISGGYLWGMVSDRWGPVRSLVIIQIGNSIFFTCTAFAQNKWHLLAARTGAGFCSPMIPSLALIFTITEPSRLLRRMSHVAIASYMGFSLGSLSVGMMTMIGWTNMHMLSTAIAVCSLLSLFCAPSISPKPKDVTNGTVRSILGNNMVKKFVARQFVFGFVFGMTSIVWGVAAVTEFGRMPRDLGMSNVVIGPLNVAFNIWIVPVTVKRLGVGLCISLFTCVMATLCILSAIPLAIFGGSFVGLTIWAQCLIYTTYTLTFVPNQSLCKSVSQWYMPNALGRITAMSRMVWAIGFTVAPPIGTNLFNVAPPLPWVFLCLLLTASLAFARMIGSPLWHDDVPPCQTSTL